MKTLLMCAVAGVALLGASAASGIVPIGGGGVAIIRPPTPAPPPGWVYRWVAPMYQTITEQVWVPERVEWVKQWMEITPGHLEQVLRQVVTPGHYETRTRRVLVSDGHYELVRIEPPPIIVEPPIVIRPPIIVDPPIVIRPPIVAPNPRTVGVEGYKSGAGEDLSKFSPLKEWPK
jgi:hypothetical protein